MPSRPREVPPERPPVIVPIAPPASPPAALATALRPHGAAPARVAIARAPASETREATTSPDDVYRAAHEAHFAQRDFGVALELWDRYLALSPLPRLAVEARYNRAIALVHLGRRDEAARALRPFADGDYGSYRAADARALLAAISR